MMKTTLQNTFYFLGRMQNSIQKNTCTHIEWKDGTATTLAVDFFMTPFDNVACSGE